MDGKQRELHDKILQLSAEYAREYLTGGQDDGRIRYAGRVFDENEVVNLVDSALEFWLTAGRYADEFEKKLAAFLGVKHCLLVNSGSSANLLAFMTLTSPLLGERAIRPGDEVITVAAGFPTTVAPILQYGAVPVFADVEETTGNLDPAQLEELLSPKTKAVMAAHTLGNPFDLARVTAFCKKHGLWLIEDNCDALGSQYTLNGETRYTGSFGDIGTSSFYPPHHMTMGEGGAVYMNDPLLKKIAQSMRDWGRDCCCPTGQDNFCGHRFDGQYGQLPRGYDHKYVYSHFGYNLKATDMQAAVGVAQLEKLPRFIEARRANFDLLRRLLKPAGKVLQLPQAQENSLPSWFGFLIGVTPESKAGRGAIVSRLEAQGIQTRMLFAGNLLRHPCFDAIRGDGSRYRAPLPLKNTDRIMNHAFWVGVYPGMTEEKIKRMAAAILECVGK